MIKRGKDPRSPVGAFRARRGRAAKSQHSSKKESTFDASNGFKSISRSHESGFFLSATSLHFASSSPLLRTYIPRHVDGDHLLLGSFEWPVEQQI